MRNEFSVSLVRQAFLLPTQWNQCLAMVLEWVQLNVEGWQGDRRRRVKPVAESHWEK